MINALFFVVARLLLRLRYRIRVTGLDAVAAKGRTGILFLPNHPALVDPVIVMTELQRRFKTWSLADQDQIDLPIVRRLAPRMGVRPLPDVGKYGEAVKSEVQRVIQGCVEGLKAGENLLMYPAGHLARARFEDLGGASAVETLLEQVPDLRVVVIRTQGLWGSSFGWASGSAPLFMQCFKDGFRYLLLNGLFFSPRREVTLELLEPEDLPHQGGRNLINRYLENVYNADTLPNTYVPHTIWERGGARVLPEPEPPRIEGDPGDVPGATRELVLAQLREMTGISEIADHASLARDLGLDSLGRMELQLWMEREFGFHGIDPESLQTVSDVLLAACGRTVASGAKTLKPIDPAWYAKRTIQPELPACATITEAFLHQAALDPARCVLGDQTSGVRSYRQVITAVLAMKPHLEALEGEYIGLMLPASVGASTLYMALLFAGKTPVLVNWTAGSRNLAHGLELLGVKQVLTVGQLVSKIETMGVDVSGIRDRLVLLEDVGKRIGKGEKLRALFNAWFNWSSLRRVKPRETAAVLFTSGSESLPKAVPLTHANILANMRDMTRIFRFNPEERMIGILPPFHSFGLVCTSILPLCIGIQVVYHPNPTEGLALAKIIEAYGVTMLVGTPTFLSGVTRAAKDQQLVSLRVVITGAEKCPEALYASIAARWPQLAVVEGYGITECSPVVAGNRWYEPKHGSIGYVVPSLEFAVVDLDEERRVEPGNTGMLLVRGPSVFGGYLRFEGASPFHEFEGKTWYRTGDLVREAEGGLLYFAGRLKRFVKMGGEMVSLPAVEEALLARFGGEDDEEIILAVEATPVDTNPELVLFTVRDITRETANVAIRDAGLSPIHNLRAVRRVEAIPLLGTGKTDYRALKAMLAQG